MEEYTCFFGDATNRPLDGGENVLVGIRGGGLAIVTQLPWKLAKATRITDKNTKVVTAFKVNDIVLEVHELCAYQVPMPRTEEVHHALEGRHCYVQDRTARVQKVLLASIILPPMDDLVHAGKARHNSLDHVTLPIAYEGLPLFAIPDTCLETLKNQEELFKSQGDK
jgi:hypothetical protein